MKATNRRRERRILLNGAGYEPSVRAIFPAKYQPLIFAAADEANARVSRLERLAKERALKALRPDPGATRGR